jgi:Protein of unknown function (DUF2680).
MEVIHMNKKIIAGILAALCISVPASVSAENDKVEKFNDKANVDISKLTDAQKADLKAQLEKMLQLKKETVQKMIDNGSITREQGEKMLEKLDIRLKSVQEGNLDFGRGKDNCPEKENKAPKKANPKSKNAD